MVIVFIHLEDFVDKLLTASYELEKLDSLIRINRDHFMLILLVVIVVNNLSVVLVRSFFIKELH